MKKKDVKTAIICHKRNLCILLRTVALTGEQCT
jgi:hypothetical protein